ncbi:MAG: AtpZ/AtpI family protein [Bacteroidota bacterium]
MENSTPNKDNKSKGASSILRFSSLGLQMGITIWLASVFGKWLDGKYPSASISWFKIITIFAVFGTITSAIVQLIRMSNEEENMEKKEGKISKFFKRKK